MVGEDCEVEGAETEAGVLGCGWVCAAVQEDGGEIWAAV